MEQDRSVEAKTSVEGWERRDGALRRHYRAKYRGPMLTAVKAVHPALS